MTELKTLKDLKWRSEMLKEHFEIVKLPEVLEFKNEWFVNEGKLKQEAIKWVKFYSKDTEDENAQFIRMWIWKFFNLTEEDLK
jgi:hypothetical protein